MKWKWENAWDFSSPLHSSERCCIPEWMDSDLHIISFALLFARWWMWVNKSDPGICRTTTHFVVLVSLWCTVKSGNLWCRKNLFIRIFHFFTLAHSSGNQQREDFHVECELKRQIETKVKTRKKSLSADEMLLKVRMCLLLFTWAVLHSWRRRERRKEATMLNYSE